jgi:galactose oxidase-like protein
MLRRRSIPLLLLVAASPMLWTGAESASGNRVVGSRHQIGEIGPLILAHKDAITAVLVWTGPGRNIPQLCYWMRNSQYKASDFIDPAGVSPDGGPTGGYIDDFRVHVRGGSRFSDRLDRSAQTIITNDLYLDNGLCLDLTHPDAFANTGLSAMATYDPATDKWVPNFGPADYSLNAAALTEVGRTAGLNYDIFCSGNVQLPDGRIAFFGGHYIDGDFGLRKVNVFDPVTMTWLPTIEPPVKTAYLAHPTGDHTLHPHPNANIEVNGDPPDPSDMKYQRWYPSAATLPNGMVLVLSGTDNDKSIGNGRGAPDDVQNTVPEVYDPNTHSFIALENARKALPNYALTYVVQTGPRRNDWKVAVTGEVAEPPPSIMPAQPAAQDNFVGNTYYLDVLAALADPNRDVPGENHWEFVATALSAHHSAGAAQLWELDRQGKAKSQKVVAFGGRSDDARVATVEMLDYQDNKPRWKRQQDLLQPVDDNYAAVLPDGKVLIVGGESPEGFVPQYSMRYQLFDPSTGTVQALGETTVPLRDHTTMILLPDASVVVGGSDRTNMLPEDLVPGAPEDNDSGVPVFSVYKPPYLFNGPRPVINKAPREIEYGRQFEVKVSRVRGRVGSVALVMPSPQTHKWDWGNRFIKLWFEETNNHGSSSLRVSAPAHPGLALPGYYMLFVLNDEGVPSEAKLVHFSVPNE